MDIDPAKESVHYPNLLIVSGTGRNVGKTELICKLIEKFSKQVDVYGLKVSSIHPYKMSRSLDDNGEAGCSLFQEISKNTSKDTSRMLRAGARKAYYLTGDNIKLQQGFVHFTQLIPALGVIICESSSLHHYVKPGLLAEVTAHHSPVVTETLKTTIPITTRIISDGRSTFSGMDKIYLSGSNNWKLL